MAEISTRVRIHPNRRHDLDLLARETGWSGNKIINRAIKELLALHYIRARQAAEVGGEHGALFTRVTHEFGAAMLVNRKLGYGRDSATDEPLITATDEVSGEESVFYEDTYGRLLVQRRLDGNVQHFVVANGELQMVDALPAPGDPVLN